MRAFERAEPVGLGTVFRAKLRGLGRDESGVALVITLAFVIPLLIMVTLSAGVGDMVRRKIRLQNSVDMAARSAAVVQADLLSKMAVVNRVTGWTYANYCRRRMDWIMGAFCKKCCDDWEKKLAFCELCANTRGLPVPYPPDSSAGVGRGPTPNAVSDFVEMDGPMKASLLPMFRQFLNRGSWTTIVEVELKHGLAEATEASLAMLKYNITKDHEILVGTDLAWKRLRVDYATQIKKAAEDVFATNFRGKGDVSWGRSACVVDFNDKNLDLVFRKLGSTDSDEKFLFEMAGLDPYLKSTFWGKDVLGAGADTWFVLDRAADHPKRIYRETNKFLQAKFEWAWYAWGIDPDSGSKIKPSTIKVDHDHGIEIVRASEIPEVASTGNGILFPDAPVTAYVLRNAFWSQSGAITVAATWVLPNLFAFMDPLLGPGSTDADPKSFWSALNSRIAGSSRPPCVMAVASARAAYKRPKTGETRRRRIEKSRYCLHPMEDQGKLRWNLCETDWDGMLIPTVAAGSMWPSEAGVVEPTWAILAELFGRWTATAGTEQVTKLTSPRIGNEPAGTATTRILDWASTGKLLTH